MTTLNREAVLKAALQRIARWHGEFPVVESNDPNKPPMSYGTAYGSNGERDFMRQVALDAIAQADALPQSQDIRNDALADLQYVAGFKAGWNAQLDGDEEALARLLDRTHEAMSALKSHPSAPHPERREEAAISKFGSPELQAIILEKALSSQPSQPAGTVTDAEQALNDLERLLQEAMKAYHNSQQWYEDGPEYGNPTYMQLLDAGFNKVRSLLQSSERGRDAERLDWLESVINEHGEIHFHDGGHAYRSGLGLRPGNLIRTLREAIDTAMPAKGGGDA